MPFAATKPKPKSYLASALRGSHPPVELLWQGPCGAGPQGGITQGLLSKYFVCPERFRIHAVDGLRPAEQFSHRLEYGNMWHVCEESLAKNGKLIGKAGTGNNFTDAWEVSLREYAQQLCRKFPLQQTEIVKWYNVCRAQFPLYVEWWSQHPDVKDRTPLLAEQVFDVPYNLPSGRTVRLRGKWDSVDLIGKGKNAGVWLQENKSKGDIDESQLRRQLSSGFDLQTMLYLCALDSLASFDEVPKSEQPAWAAIQSYDLFGVRYNVVRRPLSGGRGSIVQREATRGSKCNLKSCKDVFEKTGRGDCECEKCGGTGRVGAKPAETDAEFSARLADVIRSAHGPEWGMPVGEHYFFMRWNVAVLPADIERFRRECLDPVLENLCDDYELWKRCKVSGDDVFTMSAMPERECPKRHFITPFGIYNTLVEGGGTDLDEHIRTGSTVGLHRADDLFPELK